MFKKWLIGSVLTMLGLLTWGVTLHAQPGYLLSWFSINSGAISEASGYTLHGATGQADAGQLSTGGYTLTGGVLAASESIPGQSPNPTLYLPHLSH